jgi:hypothetical protein
LICTFCTKVHSSLGDRTRLLRERYNGCMVPWCLCLHTIVCTDECGTFRRSEIAPKETIVGKMTCVMHKVDVLTDLPKL